MSQRGDDIDPGLLDNIFAKASHTPISRAVHMRPTATGLISRLLQGLQPLQ